MTRTGTRVTIIGVNYLPEPTGIAPYTSGLASGLASRGWRVRAVTAFPHYPTWRIFEGYSGKRSIERIDEVDVTRVRPRVPRRQSGIRRLWFELHFGLRAATVGWGRPEVVVLVSPALFASVLLHWRARLTPSRPAIVIWVQDLYGLGVTETQAAGAVGGRFVTAVEAGLLRKADSVVAIHDRFKRHIVDSLGVLPERVSVVRNWTHFEPIPSDRFATREKLGWADEIVVLHAGNMGVKQALENVVQAARLADESQAAIRFVLLGNGNQRQSLMNIAEGISRIQFVDSLSDAEFQGAMAAADILLVNEKSGVAEMAVPSKLTSYFAAGRPVLAATDSGSITAGEIEAARAGLRVNADEPDALLREALALGRDVERSRQLGANGAEFQKVTLSRQTAITHYAFIIGTLVGMRGR
jgi:colanic acid biosynthesis glycosyl transferase WcaI